MNSIYDEIPTLFKTLRSVGYTDCRHPRTDDDQACMDCGAVRHGSSWIGGSLDFTRRPIRVFLKERG